MNPQPASAPADRRYVTDSGFSRKPKKKKKKLYTHFLGHQGFLFQIPHVGVLARILSINYQ
jgi:hypothetical protein